MLVDIQMFLSFHPDSCTQNTVPYSYYIALCLSSDLLKTQQKSEFPQIFRRTNGWSVITCTNMWFTIVPDGLSNAQVSSSGSRLYTTQPSCEIHPRCAFWHSGESHIHRSSYILEFKNVNVKHHRHWLGYMHIVLHVWFIHLAAFL